MSARLAWGFILTTCFAASVISQTSGALKGANIAEIYLARADQDGKVGQPSETFLVNDIPIFCVVRFTAPTVAEIRMDLLASNVPGVKAGSNVVSINYTTKENEDRVSFSGRPHGQWVAGSYRVEVFIGEKKVRNIEFEIKEVPVETANPSIVKPRMPSRKIVKRTTIAERYAR